jgi:hypothetical protein
MLEMIESLEVVASSGLGRAWIEVRRRSIGVRSVSCILTFVVLALSLIEQ